MGVLGKFESKVEGAVDGAASALFSSPIEPAQIAKKAEKQMKKEKLVGSGRQYAPTLYNVLVNERDDERLFGFYPTMASEIENYLYARGTDAGMEFDTRPLVRFITDPGLKKGRFDVIAEVVAAPIIKKLRAEEQEYYGLAPKGSAAAALAQEQQAQQPRIASQRGEQRVAQNKGAATPIPSPAERQAPVSGRFAGLDVPVDVEDISRQAELPPLSQGRDSLGGLPGLDARAADQLAGAGAVSAGAVGAGAAGGAVAGRSAADASDASAGRQASFDAGRDAPRGFDKRGAEPVASPYDDASDLPVIGRALLYNHAEQRPCHLERRKLTLGRGKDNDITLADANASRIHARLSQDATGKWKITDLGSTNGTQLNGRDISSAILKSGDEITIGTTVLEFTE